VSCSQASQSRLAARSGRYVLEHHGGELFVRDLTITVLIDLLDDLVHDALVEGLTEGQHLLDLVGRNGTTAVLVEHLEGSLQLVGREEVLLVHGGDDELRVVDLTVTVGIDAVEHLIDLLVGQVLAEELLIADLDLFLVEFTITVEVHGAENLIDLLLLLLGKKLSGNERIGGLLELGGSVEVLEIAKSGDGDLRVELLEGSRLSILNPGVVKSKLGVWTLILILGEELSDEVLGLVRNRVPDGVAEGELANLDLLHDLLIRGAIEGRDTGQHDVRDDTARPDVALGAVALGEDLGGDVIRRTELLREHLLLVVDKGGTEVDDLDLVELLVLLKQDVLGLQVSVHDVVLVAVVNAR